MKPRINSASTTRSQPRIGSAQSSPPQFGASRLIEGYHKSQNGRPSSAPVSRSPQSYSPFSRRTQKTQINNENCLSSLKIEGKAIRSVSSHVRSQILNRGPLKVLSSQRHQYHPSRRKMTRRLFRENNDTKYKNGSHILFDKTDPEVFNTTFDVVPSKSNSHFESGKCIEWDSQSMGRFRDSENSENEYYSSFIEGRDVDSPDSLTIPALHFRESVSSSCNSYSEDVESKSPTPSNEITTTARNRICLVSKPSNKVVRNKTVINVEKLLRPSETDSASNDEGSESTVASLGQKIKQMATLPNRYSTSEPQRTKNLLSESRDGNWDEEWGHLLRNNHNLLLGLHQETDGSAIQQKGIKPILKETGKKIHLQSSAFLKPEGLSNILEEIPEIIIDEHVDTIDEVCLQRGELFQQGEYPHEDSCQQEWKSLRISSLEENNNRNEKKDEQAEEESQNELEKCVLQNLEEDSLSEFGYDNFRVYHAGDSPQCNDLPLEADTKTESSHLYCNIDLIDHGNETNGECNDGNVVPTVDLKSISENKCLALSLSKSFDKEHTSNIMKNCEKIQDYTLQTIRPITLEKTMKPFMIPLSCSTLQIPTATTSVAIFKNIFLDNHKRETISEHKTACLPDALGEGNKSNCEITGESRTAMKTPASMFYSNLGFEKGSLKFAFPLRQLKTGPSRDIQNALELLENEETKDRNRTAEVKTKEVINDHQVPETATKLGNTNEKESLKQQEGASPLNLTILSEKLLIFTRDIKELLDNSPRNDPKEDQSLMRIAEAENILEEICFREKRKTLPKDAPELHRECQMKNRQTEDRIQKNLELIRKILDDKRELTEKCEKLSSEINANERKHIEKLKLLDERHALELKNVKEKLSTDDQSKREKWTQQKARLIKDSSYRNLESKMKDILTKHRDELNQLKEQQWQQLRESEEKWLNKLRDLEEQLKVKFEKEREENTIRERERNKERYSQELQQSELVWQNRLETLQKQFMRTQLEKEEEIQRQIMRLKTDHDDELRTLRRENESLKDDYEEKIRTVIRNHENETSNLKQNSEKAQNEWREQILKDLEESKQKSERELREKLRRQRDKEIEKAIREIQQEMNLQVEENKRTADTKIKNLRERFEAEMSEIDASERISRSRYLEMKGILVQKEEEIVYLRARLHTQILELNDFQQMFQVQN